MVEIFFFEFSKRGKWILGFKRLAETKFQSFTGHTTFHIFTQHFEVNVEAILKNPNAA
jgi:hypothetical protein